MNEHPGAAAAASSLVTHTRAKIQLAFAAIYIVWGVTYAVNRIMVLALPPLLAAGSRFILAGALLILLARSRGLALPRSARDWRSVGAAAALGIVLSNGLSVLALRHVASNQAALINSSAAFWIAWLGMYGQRAAHVTPRTWSGLALGFVGVGILVSAHGFGAPTLIGWQLALLLAALCWALATMVIRESRADCDPLAFTACYLMVGGICMTTLALVNGDAARWSWSAAGLASIVFLAIFSSTFGFVAYTYLLLHETPSRIGTYAYVNPVVAVVTGWLLLDEHLDRWQLLGAGVIFAGVGLVRNVRLWPRARESPPPAAAG